jgi:hypothetical protein
LQNDRLTATKYQDEKKLLEFDENKAYRVIDGQCIQNTREVYPQVRLGKDSIGNIINKSIGICDSPKTVRHKYGLYTNVLLSDEELEKLKSEFRDYKDRIERLSEYIESKGVKYKSHLATIRSWARKEVTQKATKKTEKIEW